MQGDLSINEWDIIIVQIESLFRVKFTTCSFVAILNEANAIMRQMSSSTNAQESENAMRDVLRSARHVLAMDVFANKSTLAFLKQCWPLAVQKIPVLNLITTQSQNQRL